MAAKKCPLCGGRVKDSYCVECGYSIPDEEELSALYNYDPADYPQDEPKGTGYAYAEPEPLNAPNFKVADNPYSENNADRNADNGASPYANNTPPSPYNPYANKNFKPYVSGNRNAGTGGSSSFAECLKQYWWLLLLSFFVPVVGILMLCTMKNFDRNFQKYVIAAIVLGFILPP